MIMVEALVEQHASLLIDWKGPEKARLFPRMNYQINIGLGRKLRVAVCLCEDVRERGSRRTPLETQ